MLSPLFFCRLGLADLQKKGVGVMMDSSGMGMAALTLLNYTGGKCVWLLIIWQAVCLCVCLSVLQHSPWGGDVRSEQLDASHLCGGVQNNPCAEL